MFVCIIVFNCFAFTAPPKISRESLKGLLEDILSSKTDAHDDDAVEKVYQQFEGVSFTAEDITKQLEKSGYNVQIKEVNNVFEKGEVCYMI